MKAWKLEFGTAGLGFPPPTEMFYATEAEAWVAFLAVLRFVDREYKGALTVEAGAHSAKAYPACKGNRSYIKMEAVGDERGSDGVS